MVVVGDEGGGGGGGVVGGGLEPDISGASAPRRSTPAHSHCVFSAAYSL